MSEKPTLLLVHGAWHGAWAWNPVASILENRGWAVERIDLPTVHAADPVGLHLADDADAITAAIAAIDGPVVVVAHSYGGVPTTQAATADNVQHIVYVAAFALDEGESLLGAVGGVAPSWWVVDGPLATAGTDDEPPASIFFADVDADAAAAASARLKPQSVLAFQEPLTEVAWRTKPSTYIVTEQDAIFPVPAQEGLAARAGSTVRRLDTSHSPFLSQPEAVADIIEEAARS
ncbi:pimeloyl-ACP methyl ester carboxylesterase [Microbacterium sp. AG1240]|uniref:alpha/beta fold hydrolase n=1 Tax=Microbacterium sp. AG1240 TaxID=2183992 RepID=UPI000EB382AE|nr:alpha/beta fold hydrolase [Microbacterium sp. AG1240]RKT36133.1 pimeloyl-ACP methyl ester carboxylesterase [Microbacterium sp. AG1240]